MRTMVATRHPFRTWACPKQSQMTHQPCQPSTMKQRHTERRYFRTQSGKHIQIGITCRKYCQMSNYNLRMVTPSPPTRCSNCWTATRALECSRAPGMRTTRHVIGRGHILRVRPKRTSIVISNDDHTFAMVENVGLIIGQQFFASELRYWAHPTSGSFYSGSIAALRFTQVRTFMHTKPAGTACNVPGGMCLASESGLLLTYNNADSGKNITAQNMNRHQSPAACFRLIVSELWMKLRNSL